MVAKWCQIYHQPVNDYIKPFCDLCNLFMTYFFSKQVHYLYDKGLYSTLIKTKTYTCIIIKVNQNITAQNLTNLYEPCHEKLAFLHMLK